MSSTPLSSTLSSTLRNLLQTYADLNAPSTDVEYLPYPPSPLEFSRIVARNRPVIIRNAFNDWPAMGAEGSLPDWKWTAEYLKEKMGNMEVQVAMTPKGYAVCNLKGMKRKVMLIVGNA